MVTGFNETSILPNASFLKQQPQISIADNAAAAHPCPITDFTFQHLMMTTRQKVGSLSKQK